MIWTARERNWSSRRASADANSGAVMAGASPTCTVWPVIAGNSASMSER